MTSLNFLNHIQIEPERKLGDLHDGNGLSDATKPNGEITNPIFENIDYDLLTPGNHELIAYDVAYEAFSSFTQVYGEKYLASNLDICKNCQDNEPTEKEWVAMGSRYRHFTTKHGIRIMAFGVILDGTNNNKSMTRIQPAAEMIEEDWFKKAVNTSDLDIFVLIGHNPVKPGIPKAESSFPLLMETLRKARPEIPVQGFGGHTHRRDFHVYDEKSSAIESGKYCDTVGWISLDGITSKSISRRATKPELPSTSGNDADLVNVDETICPKNKTFKMDLTRRYLDWNRLTFSYHASGSQDQLDTASGLNVSQQIDDARSSHNLTHVYGCAPRTYCISCKPSGDEGNVYTLVKDAAAATVVDPNRANKSRMIIVNQGAIRYDLVKGPFTVDDSYIVCPYTNAFKYIPDVPYSLASKVLDYMIEQKTKRKRSMTVDSISSQLLGYDECDNPSTHNATSLLKPKSLFGRVLETDTATPGYTTCDDLGNDGDDTPHSTIPDYPQQPYVQATAQFPSNGEPDKTDIIFSDFLAGNVVSALNSFKPETEYSTDDVALYLPANFTTNSFIPRYATMAWQDNIDNCKIEEG